MNGSDRPGQSSSGAPNTGNGALAPERSPAIPPRGSGGPCRLSFAQARLWFLDQYEPGTPLYNIPAALHIEGALDIEALEKALSGIVARHEVLRTTYQGGEEHPVQVVNPVSPFELPRIDLTGLEDGQREVEARRLIRRHARQPFELSRDLMLRAVLLRLDERKHILLLVVHHIASDGWSIGVLYTELHALYNAYSAGESPELPELPVQYADFAQWQRERLTGEILDRHMAYWEERLDGCPSVLQLPADHPRPALQTFNGAAEEFDLGDQLSADIRRLAQSRNATTYMVLLAAFQVLLHRYTGQEEILVGSPIAGRTHQEIEGSIGFFVNTLVQRADLTRGQSFADLIAEVRRTAIESYHYQELPFEKLVDAIQPERNLSHSPLVQVLFVFQNTPVAKSTFSGLDVKTMWVSTETAKFDWMLSMGDRGGTLRGALEFNSDLFEASTVRRVLGHFRNLLASVVRDPEQEVSRLPLLSTAEKERILVDWNDTDAEYPRVCLGAQFERQVLETPDAAALEFEGQSLTYKELDERADGIARRLRQAGVEPKSRVGVLLERSPDSVAAILGVLKAGAAYVPLDAGQPPGRLALLVADSGIELLVVRNRPLDAALPESLRTLSLDALPALEDERPVTARTELDDLLYVVYTSGSTGQPKGVAMPQRPLVNLLAWQSGQLSSRPGIRTAQLAPLSFDVSCQEIFSTLTSGGTLVVVPERLRKDPEGLWRFLGSERVERLYLPFVGLEQLAEAAAAEAEPPLREVITAGEQLRITPRIRRFFTGLPECKLINQYGPSETHVATAYELPGEPETWPELPPIGRPVANTQTYVLDPGGQPVPVGVPGELYLGGDCLARGYLGRDDLTEERFVPNPFDAGRSPRLYRTGDLVRCLPDGNLLFLGRNDDQVKIRGYRVEPGEIENTLARHAGVDMAAVAVREETGFKRLVAYVVPAGGQPELAKELRELARRTLPDYMLPAAYVFLDKLPLTRTGKVDRGALPSPDSADPSLEESFVPPRNELERGIAGIWEELLGVRPVGVGHDFFDLGGHSLLATRLVAHIDKRYGQRIGLVDFFQAPTIEGVAALLNQPPPETAPVRRKAVRAAAPRPPLLLVHPLPLFRPLEKRLRPGQPVAYLKMPLISQLPKDHTVDDLVEPMLEQALREHSEPYCIGGWCRYGLLAYELAYRLHMRGKRISSVVLLDVPNPHAMRRVAGWAARRMYYRIIRYQFSYHLACLKQLSAPEAVAYVAARTGMYLKYLGRKLAWRLTPGRGANGQAPSLRDEFTPNLYGYLPEPFDGRIVLVTADKVKWSGCLDSSLGWNQLTKLPVEVVSVPGNHLSMFLEPHVDLLAGRLTELLGRSG